MPQKPGKYVDKPSWWPKKPKWKTFRCPSKSSKHECTKLIRRLLERHGIDADKYYINFPEEEEQDTSSDSSSDKDVIDENNSHNEELYQEEEEEEHVEQ